MKIIFIILGTISLGIGITGIFIPGLPTTPFILLTAGLYMRSSERLYQWLLSNRHIGPYISEYRRNKGMTVRVKLASIFMMWAMILFSGFFFLESLTSRLILAGVGIAGTLVMGFIIPTVRIGKK